MARLHLCCLLFSLPQFASPLLAAEEPTHVDRHGDPLPPLALARLGTVRFRHAESINCFAYSPDGKLLATGGQDKTLSIWDAQSGRKMGQFSGHPGGVRALAFSRDGKVHASISHNAHSDAGESSKGDIRLWNMEDPKLWRPLREAEENSSLVAFGPDGRTIASGHRSGCVRLWDASTGRMMHLWANKFDQRGVAALAFAPEGERLAVAGFDGKVLVWELTPKEKLRCEATTEGIVNALAYSPDGKVLAIATTAGILLCRASNLEVMYRLKVPEEEVALLAFNPDSKTLFSAGKDKTIHVWDVESGEHRRQFRQHHSNLKLLGVSPNGKQLATTEEGGANAIQLWDAQTGEALSPPGAALSSVEQVAFLNDGKSVVTQWGQSRFSIWPYGTGNQSSELKLPRGARAGLLCPDRSSLIFGTTDRLGLLDISSVREFRRWPTEHLNLPIAVSIDKQRVAVHGKEFFTEVVDFTSGKFIYSKPHFSYDLAKFSPDLRLLALGKFDQVHVYDLDTKKEIFPVKNGDEITLPQRFGKRGQIYNLAFSPDGRMIITQSSDWAIHLWETATGKERRCLEGQYGVFRAIAFSSDGRMLAMGNGDPMVRLWNLGGTKEPLVFRGHRGGVNSIDFSPNGSRLLSGSDDTTALIWDIPLACGNSGTAALQLGREEQLRLWGKLADQDAATAYTAQQRLATSPAEALSLCRVRLLQTPPTPPEQIRRWIAQLDDEEFAVREQASLGLERAEAEAENALESALKGDCNLEVRRRIELLLETLKSKQLPIRVGRAVELLEQIGTAEAVNVLRQLEKKAGDAALRREIQGSLHRLAGKRKVP